MLNLITLSPFIICLLYIIRAKAVHSFRMSVIRSDRDLNRERIKRGRSDLIDFNYKNLPSDDYMINKFWIWNFERFLKVKRKKMNQKAIDLYEMETLCSWYARRNNEFIAEEVRAPSDEFLEWLGKRAEMSEYARHNSDCAISGKVFDPRCTCGFSKTIASELAINKVLEVVINE